MHKSRPAVVVIDCRTDDLGVATDFWSAALGYPVDAARNEGDTKYAALKEPPGEMGVILQAVDHPSRVHLDIETDDVEAEVARLEKLGAKRLGTVKRWVVMEAPSGHRFCVVRPQRSDFPEGANVWDE